MAAFGCCQLVGSRQFQMVSAPPVTTALGLHQPIPSAAFVCRGIHGDGKIRVRKRVNNYKLISKLSSCCISGRNVYSQVQIPRSLFQRVGGSWRARGGFDEHLAFPFNAQPNLQWALGAWLPTTSLIANRYPSDTPL